MNCLLFFMFVAVSSIRSTVFDNAQHFVKSISTIDPDKINPLIDMVNSMIAENDKILEGLQNKVDDASTKKDAADKTLVSANAALVTAQQNKLSAQQELGDLNQDVTDKKQDEDHAVSVDNAAQADLQSKTDNLNSEKDRIAAEDVILKDIRDMIANLNTNEIEIGRHLVSVDIKSMLNADPESITELLGLIDGLIQAGQADLQTAQNAYDAASSEADRTAAARQDATNAVTIAIGKASQQNEKVKLLVTAEEQATQTVQQSSDALDTATTVLNLAKSNYDNQKTKIDGERDEMNAIISLLDRLKD